MMKNYSFTVHETKIIKSTFSGETEGNASQISKNRLFAFKPKFFEFCGISGPDIFAAQFVAVHTFFFELSQMCFFTWTEWSFKRNFDQTF